MKKQKVWDVYFARTLSIPVSDGELNTDRTMIGIMSKEEVEVQNYQLALSGKPYTTYRYYSRETLSWCSCNVGNWEDSFKVHPASRFLDRSDALIYRPFVEDMMKEVLHETFLCLWIRKGLPKDVVKIICVKLWQAKSVWF